MENKYLQDLAEIKNMMQKSTQYISLSGLAGVMAGIYALIGVYVTKELLKNNSGLYKIGTDNLVLEVIFYIAILILLLSLITAFLLTYLKAKKNNDTVINSISIRLAINFLIPLGAGGLFALILIQNKFYVLVVPTTLIFYGLACVNASKYTFSDIRYLGLISTILGLISAEFPNYALEFWALGFGFFHILYGSWMYFKYDRKN